MADDANLQLLLDSFVAIASERDVEAVLEQAVDLARLSTKAKYGAAVAIDAEGITAFVHRGMTTAQVAALPHVPVGLGMLGAVLEDKAPIRLEQLQSEGRSVGFPLGHVPMSAFLGVPILFDDELLGAVYLTKPPGQGTFSEEDELFMAALARQAGGALASARALRDRDIEIVERHRAEALVGLLQVVAVAANQAATVEEALRSCLDEVCRATHWPVGHVYLPDGSGDLLSTLMWHLDDPDRFATFRELTEATPLRAGVGLPGEVLASRQPKWITDVTVPEANFARAAGGADIAVRAAFAFPVVVGNEVVAVLEFFRPEPTEPDDAMLEVMAIIGRQVGRVAERQKASEALERANAELRVADQVKSDFVSMASHELRTPLTSILGFSSTLQEYWDSTSDVEKLEYVAVIDRQARRLSRLVNDLLAMSRIESGKLAVRQAVVDVVEIANATVASLGEAAAGVEVRSPGPHLDVHADPDHVEQIVMNYVGNALKYGDPPVTVEITKDDRFVELRVCDAGAGVDEGFRSHLFEKFAQASTGSTRRASGTGLGLSIVRGLARANGGEAWYEPRPGGGAVFAVRFREP
jgi:signal transduction histidine kinase